MSQACPSFEKKSKSEYRRFLNEVIGWMEDIMQRVDDDIYVLIYNQLLDIKENVVDWALFTEWDEINQRYTLGGLAVKNFEEDDEMRMVLVNVFCGAIHYSEYPE